MKPYLIILLIALIFFGIGCKNEQPPTEPPLNDSLSITETFVTNGLQPAISPNGKTLAFSINGDIYICDTTGFNAKQLTSGGEYDFLPRWHPDGKTIGFVRALQPYKNRGTIYVVDTVTGVIQQLNSKYFVADTLLLPYYEGTVPIWDFSPDGKTVALLSKSTDTTFLRLISFPEGTEIKSLFTYTHSPLVHGNDVSGFSFSPSGDQIVYTALGNDLYSYLYKTDVSHDTMKQIINDTRGAAYPCWANNGDIIVESYLPIPILDSSGKRKDGLFRVWQNPKWSPDAKYILSEQALIIGDANSYTSSRLLLTVVENDTWFNLNTTGDIDKHNYFFVWGPSSKIIYYEKFNKIWKITFR